MVTTVMMTQHVASVASSEQFAAVMNNSGPTNAGQHAGHMGAVMTPCSTSTVVLSASKTREEEKKIQMVCSVFLY